MAAANFKLGHYQRLGIQYNLQFLFSILEIVIPTLFICDATARVLSPRKYKAFLVWLNQRRPYSGSLSNVASERQIRLVGVAMLLFIAFFFWEVHRGSNGVSLGTAGREELSRTSSWASFILGLGLIIGGVIALLKPWVLRQLLLGATNLKKMELPEANLL
jgi:hypothetical protein